MRFRQSRFFWEVEVFWFDFWFLKFKCICSLNMIPNFQLSTANNRIFNIRLRMSKKGCWEGYILRKDFTSQVAAIFELSHFTAKLFRVRKFKSILLFSQDCLRLYLEFLHLNLQTSTICAWQNRLPCEQLSVALEISNCAWPLCTKHAVLRIRYWLIAYWHCLFRSFNDFLDPSKANWLGWK